MAEYKLTLEPRELTGRHLKSLRADGKIPSVVYGGKAPVLLASEYVATEKILEKAGYHSPIDLDIAGKKRLAIVKDVHIDPVSRKIINVEFQAISAREVVEATTPVVLVNFEASEASKTHHYAINQAIEELDVKAKPADLPKELEIDASAMVELDDKITIKDIVLPQGVELADKELDPEQVVASLYDPAAEAAAREAEEQATTAEAEASEEATEAEPAAKSESPAEDTTEEV